jgi:tetratricopeptide (TPR) repeat protein
MPLQQMIFQIDIDVKVPTPVLPQDSQQQAMGLLTEIAPTPTMTSTSPPGAIAMIQPTAIALAPTATFTPVYSVSVDPSAQDKENQVDLADAIELLQGFDWEQQGYNNCGPASIRVLMSYWDKKYGDAHFTEEQAAKFLKPNPDDPNVRPDEIASFVETFGYHAFIREGGNFEMIKTFILAGYPVLIETGYDPEPDKVGWTSHYLTVVGYTSDAFIVMDTYRRPNWGMKFNEVDYYWRQFDRHYLIIYRPEQYAAVASILGEEIDDVKMLDSALTVAHSELSLDQNDEFGWFNLGTILVKQGRYEEAAKAYDEARRQELPWRMLWYQFGPYEAYMKMGRYEDVIALADDVLKRKESEEAYYYKALALEKQGEVNLAIIQLQHAVHANKNFDLAKQALERLKGGG